MSPSILGWCAVCAVFIGAVVSVLRPDNKALPFDLPMPTRALIAAGLGAVQACLTAIVGGTSWLEAVLTAVATVVAAFAAHGADHTQVTKGAAVVAFCFFGLSATGCTLLQGKQAESVLNTVLSDADKVCILTNAIYPNATIQAICKIEGSVEEITKVVEAVALPMRGELAMARARANVGACRP